MFASLRIYPAIRWLWIGTLATNTAFWMYQVALGWLALEMTDSPLWVGLAGFAGGIPILFFALPAGVVVDNFDRRHVLMGGQIGVMITATLFSGLIYADLMNRWSMLALAFLYGSSMSFVFPTRHAIIGRLVEPRDLANAIALNSAGQNATRIFGPALAGALIAVVDTGGTFAVAAAMQIFALASTLRLPSSRPRDPGKRGPALASITEGLVYVRRDPTLLGTILLATIGTVLIMPYINLMPVFVRDELGYGSGGLGVLMTGIGIGSVGGALLVAARRELTSAAGAQVLLISAWAVLVLVFAWTPWVVPAGILLLLSGTLSAGFLATNQTILQLRSDDAIRGRVLAVNQITWGLLPIGQLPLGLLAEITGAPLATSLACIAALLLIALTFARVPALRGADELSAADL
ncbi:MAG TPA: MFS transporter [Thermomicrobiales bacterium]|nr:MFS transporter [Thermomicrobiales bacterium]